MATRQGKALSLYVPVLVVLATSGCTEYSASSRPKGAVGVGLVAETPRARELATVNTIGIAPVKFEGAEDAPSTSAVNQELLKAFESETVTEVKPVGPKEIWSSDVPTNLVNSSVAKTGRTKAQSSLQDTRPTDDRILFSQARDQGGDALLITTLHTLSERVGSAAGAEASAKVGFSMRMLRVSDGAEIWNAVYSFSDAALTDNILRLSSRVESPGWRKAREILKSAFASAARDFNDKRTAQFVVR